jgi:hypothetical protein
LRNLVATGSKIDGTSRDVLRRKPVDAGRVARRPKPLQSLKKAWNRNVRVNANAALGIAADEIAVTEANEPNEAIEGNEVREPSGAIVVDREAVEDRNRAAIGLPSLPIGSDPKRKFAAKSYRPTRTLSSIHWMT